MVVEIEAKMRLQDRAALEAKLRELGAEYETSVLEINTYFDTPQWGLKSGDQGLRIRVEKTDEATRVVVTYKGPRAHGRLKSRSETEVVVDSAAGAADLLTALGYTPVLSFEKFRRRWVLGDCRIELDTLPYLGDYVEIEGEDERSVMAVREQLGLDQTSMIRASYIAMLMTHLHENDLPSQSIRFNGEAPDDAGKLLARTD